MSFDAEIYEPGDQVFTLAADRQLKIHKVLNDGSVAYKVEFNYDDETLNKVRQALFNVLGGNINDQRLTDCISEMQNAGILFRERG